MNEDTQRWTLMGVILAIPVILVAAWASAAQTRLKENAAISSLKDVAIASMTDDSYCTPQLKAIIRRVAGSCGLIEGSGGRGCQPMEAKKVAALSGDDFNALFKPLSRRESKFKDEDLKNQVGLLWLGEQYAQLGDEFCSWNRSRNAACTAVEINRSAFVAWIDCAI